MAITYVDTFHLIGLSGDTKPNPAPKGCIFFETDTQKHFLFDGIWKDIKGGTGVWSPSQAETLTNKRMVINDNDFETNSGANGLFGFLNAGFNFIPIGSAGLFLKVNSQGTGFEFADPATSGSWNPNATEEITNKTINSQLNTIKQTTPAAGSLLLDNGTKFVPLAKGANNTFLGVDTNGVVGYYEVVGGGGGNNYYNALPSQSDQLWGWWSPITTVIDGHGVLHNNMREVIGGVTPSIVNSAARGRNLAIAMNSSTDDYGIICDAAKMWRREYDSYMKFKWRIDVSTTYSLWVGMVTNTTNDYDDIDELDGADGFCFAREYNQNNYQIISNDGSANQSIKATLGTRDSQVHTIELCSDSANNRFGYRLDDEAGAWVWVTSNIPRTGLDLGIITRCGSETSTSFTYEQYLLETYNKLMV